MEYKRPLAGLFARFSLLGWMGKTNRLHGRTLEGSKKESTITIGKGKNQLLSSQLFLSKRMERLPLVLQWQTDYNYIGRPLLLGGTQSQLVLQTLSTSLDISSQPIQWLDLKLSSLYSQTWQRSIFDRRTSNHLYLTAQAHLFIGEDWTFGLTSGTILTHSEAQQTSACTLLDAKLKLQKRRYSIAFSLENLLNAQLYQQHLLLDADSYQSYQQLRPRQGLLTFTLKY